MHVRMLETMAKCFSGGPCSDTGFIYRAYQHVPKVALRNPKGMAFFGAPPNINPPFPSLVGWSQAAKMAAMREREEALEMKVLGWTNMGFRV